MRDSLPVLFHSYHDIFPLFICLQGIDRYGKDTLSAIILEFDNGYLVGPDILIVGNPDLHLEGPATRVDHLTGNMHGTRDLLIVEPGESDLYRGPHSYPFLVGF